ncbi:TRAP transporter substrate-binding protein [Anaerobacillus alkaliphilus]|uniref:TRAP transporter substrate-binding protein n=1 Tax=Anaerobacillus alkaliphilus TaxID=1548597 RepID=A0A4Q0VSA2_9BACI|nr:TRAP transporter substrate-binding protein [Anaerobacillus alkaliphilus]RXI98300.1 TRAP transporter substrate-binding protein [Anaerobacillus alkaliphilus]
MKKIKRIASVLAVSTMLLFATACGGGTSKESSSTETYSFKLAHITPTNHMWHIAAEKFGEELKERSGGRMSLEIYPASQLGTEADMVQQIASGSVDFGLITSAYMSSRSPSFAAWFMPYAFETLEEAHEARTSEVAKKILGTLDEQGLVGLDYLFAGQRVMLFKDREVLSPADMAGLQLRVTPSPPMQDFYRSTGASTEGLPLPEVYAAVQTGVIDGMDMDLDATITNKYFEVVKHAAVTNHMVWPSVAIVNKGMFEGMSEADQKIVRDAFKVAADFAVTTRAGQEEEFKQILRDEGMNVYELDSSVFADQIREFDEKYGAVDPLIKEFIEKFRK